MVNIVCRGCRKILQNETVKKDIFTENISVCSSKGDVLEKKYIPMKLFTGIELITGKTVSKEDGLSTIFCGECCNKVEEYINFRIELITSVTMLDISKDSCEKGSGSSISLETDDKNKETTILSLEKIEDKKLSDETSTVILNEDSSDKSEEQEKESFFEDFITFNERPLNLITLAKFFQEHFANKNDKANQINNVPNELDRSNENLESQNTKEITIKTQDNDIESEIDVCSCEDDDIIELEVPIKSYEIIEIESSSDSDIEVCDYEPTGKRSKNHSALSPLF